LSLMKFFIPNLEGASADNSLSSNISIAIY